jgi:hypothetical protein
MRDLIVDCSVDDGQMKDDGLVKSPIYVVVDLKRRAHKQANGL